MPAGSALDPPPPPRSPSPRALSSTAPPAPAHAGAASATVAHGTLSLRVTVRYPFHPLAGRELEVLTDQKDSVTVRGLDGFDLKVPKWALSPWANPAELSASPRVVVHALLAVAALVADAGRVLTAPPGEVGDPPTSRPEKTRHAPTGAHKHEERSPQKDSARNVARGARAEGRGSSRAAQADGASPHRRRAKRKGGQR